MKRRGIVLLLFLCAAAPLHAHGVRTACVLDPAKGFDRSVMLQQPGPDAIQIVEAPGGRAGRAIRVSVSRDASFGGVANGAPRAELSFAPSVHFALGRHYTICWSTFLPADYAPDRQQPEAFMQIHCGPNQGQPAFGITAERGRLVATVRNGPGPGSASDLGAIATGRWQDWQLDYQPDDSGAHAVTELSLDGRVVASFPGRANAYPGDQGGYLKLGVYKWWWKSRPSDATERTIYLGKVTISMWI